MSFAIGDGKKSEPSSSSSMQRSCHHFEFHEILIATENFDESLVIGSGGFGKVYKGNVTIGSNPVVAAIKRWDFMSNQGAAEFWAEVEMLSMLRHCNLVSLIGYLKWFQDTIKEGNLKRIIDLDIRGEISPKCLMEYVKLAESCFNDSPKQRPTMAEVVVGLESVMALQEKFNKSLQSAWRTIFGRIVKLFSFSSNREVSGNSNSFSLVRVDISIFACMCRILVKMEMASPIF
ncbi:hypothetical protein E3N88_22917 [Mikania micrantha]|uniref:Protein kinase domain-containing protein n=1 Tax=Mikania micrantha TaxID=192012 RepID=A0A5N6NBT2_9ASTR|nr:hypothetical protein E3N88_22917 [Mikania micrantha]